MLLGEGQWGGQAIDNGVLEALESWRLQHLSVGFQKLVQLLEGLYKRAEAVVHLLNPGHGHEELAEHFLVTSAGYRLINAQHESDLVCISLDGMQHLYNILDVRIRGFSDFTGRSIERWEEEMGRICRVGVTAYLGLLHTSPEGLFRILDHGLFRWG